MGKINWRKRLDIDQEVKRRIRSIFCLAKNIKMNQKELLVVREMLFKNIKGKLPQYMITFLNGYFEGIYDLFKKENLIFLYNYKGNFYKTRRSVDLFIPYWDEIPKEDWDKLGDCGGMYYIKQGLNGFVKFD